VTIKVEVKVLRDNLGFQAKVDILNTFVAIILQKSACYTHLLSWLCTKILLFWSGAIILKKIQLFLISCCFQDNSFKWTYERG